MRELSLLVVFATVVSAAPVTVLITGNFGPGSGGSTVLDNQNYSILFPIPDPHSPSASFSMGAAANATYQVPVMLNIPGLGISISNFISADYRNDPSTLPTLGMWLNLTTFTGLPVGDFMVMTPLTTAAGPLWNGLAGTLGTPEILPLNQAPAHARFFVEKNTPGQGPIPLAVYDAGTAFITQTSPAPEPGTIGLIVTGLLALAGATRRSLF